MQIRSLMLSCLVLTASLAFSGAALAMPDRSDPMPPLLQVADGYADSVAAFDPATVVVLLETEDRALCEPMLKLSTGNCYAPAPAGHPAIRQVLGEAINASCITAFDRGPPG